MLMNHADVRCLIGTQPKTCSKKCVTPTTLKPLEATSSSDSSARPDPLPSVSTIRSGRWASTISERSATLPRTGTPASGSLFAASSTMPTTWNGTSVACCALSERSLAQLPVPTTSTRLLAANWRRQSASQMAARAKTDRAITDSVARVILVPGMGTQKLPADTTTRPVRVPTKAGTAGPSVKGTAPNALRSVTNQVAVTIATVNRSAGAFGAWRDVSQKTGRRIVAARPISATALASMCPSAGSEIRAGPAGDRTTNPPGSCIPVAKSLLSPPSQIPKSSGREPLRFREPGSILCCEAHRSPRLGWRGQVLDRAAALGAPRPAGDPPRPALLEAGLGGHSGSRVARDPAARGPARGVDRGRHSGGKADARPLARRRGHDRLHGRLALDLHQARRQAQAGRRERPGDARGL